MRYACIVHKYLKHRTVHMSVFTCSIDRMISLGTLFYIVLHINFDLPAHAVPNDIYSKQINFFRSKLSLLNMSLFYLSLMHTDPELLSP